jgi:hypothetical protein
MPTSDPLLLGLKLYEPKTFLFLDNYLTSLQLQTEQSATVLLLCGVWLVLTGLLFRRLSAALMFGALAWAAAGMLAMTQHLAFAALTFGAGGLAVALGIFVPRLSHALVASVVLALVVRAIVIFVDGDLALYGVLGGAAAGFLVAILAWESWVALCTAAIGAVIVAYSLSGVLGGKLAMFSLAERDKYAALYGGLATFVFLIGLVVQLRTGEITWKRAREWRAFRFLQKKKAA